MRVRGMRCEMRGQRERQASGRASQKIQAGGVEMIQTRGGAVCVIGMTVARDG